MHIHVYIHVRTCLDNGGVLREGQAGFRVDRSCMDVYSLNEMVQGRLSNIRVCFLVVLIQCGAMICFDLQIIKPITPSYSLTSPPPPSSTSLPPNLTPHPSSLPHSLTPYPSSSTRSGYSHLSIRDPPTAPVSSDDFAQIMQNLQESRNVIQDPSRALSIAVNPTDTSE